MTIHRKVVHTQKNGLIFTEYTKTHAGYRVLTIPKSIQQLFARVRAKQAEYRAYFGAEYYGERDLVFSKPDGSPITPDSLTLMVTKLRKKLKLPGRVTLHTLRHSHGSHLIRGGIELTAVSKRLGHSSTAVTARVYAHMLDGRDRAAAEVWEEMNQERPQ